MMVTQDDIYDAAAEFPEGFTVKEMATHMNIDTDNSSAMNNIRLRTHKLFNWGLLKKKRERRGNRPCIYERVEV